MGERLLTVEVAGWELICQIPSGAESRILHDFVGRRIELVGRAACRSIERTTNAETLDGSALVTRSECSAIVLGVVAE